MEEINHDVLAKILSLCDVKDWVSARLVDKKWRKCADRIDVVQRVYARARGYSVEGLSAEKYKELILEGRAVEKVMLPECEAVRAVPFDVPEELAGELNALGLPLYSESLEQAGLPDHVAMVHCRDDLSYRMVVWNGLTLKLERVLNLGEVLNQVTPFRSKDGEPRFVSLVANGNAHHIELWNPLSGERVQQSQSWERPDLILGLQPKLISGQFLPQPRLLVYYHSQQANGGRTLLKFFDVADLEVADTHEYDQLYAHPINWEGRVRLVHEDEVYLLDVLTGKFERNQELEADRITWTVRIQGRTRFISRQGHQLSWVGSPQELQVDPHSYVDVRGAHWNDHDYILLCVTGVVQTVHLWRDDGQTAEISYDRMRQLSPLRLPRRWILGTGRFHGPHRFVPVGRGLVWTGGVDSRPIGIFPAKLKSEAGETRGYTRLFLIAGLTALVLGALAYRWLRPRPLGNLARTVPGRTVRG